MNKALKQWLYELQYDRRPTVDECIQYMGDIFPLMREYKNTIQDKIWHAEGDVHIHTDMVLQEIYKIFDENEFTPTQKRILILSALLHDICKPVTTYEKEKEGRLCIVASKHEDIGRDYLVYRLAELELPDFEYKEILNLVGLHQKPKMLVVKSGSRADYFKLMFECGYKLLYWLEVADMKGRICDDLEMSLMYLDEFYETCEKYSEEYWNMILSLKSKYNINRQRNLKVFKEFTYVDDAPHINYYLGVSHYDLMYDKIYMAEEVLLKYYGLNYDHMRSNVVIMCGIAGSGKSTLINEKYPEYHVISLDDIRKEINGKADDQSDFGRVIQLAKERLKQHLRKKENVVWDATNYRKDFRDQIISICMNYQAYVKIEVVVRKLSDIKLANSKRARQVDEEVILKQMERFQYPERHEAHEVIWNVS